MVIAKNKKSTWEYKIIDEFVTGIVLFGSEMKPIRNGKVSISEAYCFVQDGEVFIKGMHISEYQLAGKYDTHEPTRIRKLLLNRKEITQIQKKITQKGMTLIPLNIHTTDTGLIKVKIGLGKGKKLYDKRETVKARDTKIDIDRESKKY